MYCTAALPSMEPRAKPVGQFCLSRKMVTQRSYKWPKLISVSLCVLMCKCLCVRVVCMCVSVCSVHAYTLGSHVPLAQSNNLYGCTYKVYLAL